MENSLDTKNSKKTKPQGFSRWWDWSLLILLLVGLAAVGYLIYATPASAPVSGISDQFVDPLEEPLFPALKENPSPVPVQKESRSLEMGKKYFNEGKLKKALIYINQAAQENPRSKEAYFYLGLISVREKEWQPAIKFFTQAIVLDPQDKQARRGRAEAYFQLALAAEQREEWEKSYQQLEEAKQYYPDKKQWKRVWLRVASQHLNRTSIQFFLNALGEYRKANQVFLKGWERDLPSTEAEAFFRESQVKFLKLKTFILGKKSEVPEKVMEFLGNAIDKRLESLKVSLKLAKLAKEDSLEYWEGNLAHLKAANEAIGETGVLFSEWVAVKGSLYDKGEYKQLTSQVSRAFKRLLVVSGKSI